MRTRTCSGQDPGPPLRGTARTDAPRPGRRRPDSADAMAAWPTTPSDATTLVFCTPRPLQGRDRHRGVFREVSNITAPGQSGQSSRLTRTAPETPCDLTAPGLSRSRDRGAQGQRAASAAAKRPLALGQPRACQAHPLASLVPTRGPPEHPSAAAPASSDDAPPCVFGLRPKTRTRPRPASGRKK